MPSDTHRQIDPITLTLIWNSLISIAEEMSGALRRTAFSEAVREGEDFSAGARSTDIGEIDAAFAGETSRFGGNLNGLRC